MIAKDFNLKYTVESAQPLTFFGDYSAEGSYEKLSYVTQHGMLNIAAKSLGADNSSEISCNSYGDYSDNEAWSEARKRLSLGDDIRKIYSRIGTDSFMHSAISGFYGMRITENDPWETALCFVVSQFNNVKRIRFIMKRLIGRFGDEEELNGKRVRLFPSAKRLSAAKVNEIFSCGTGFRARYIRSAALAFSDESFASSLYGMKYADAKVELTKIKGIGEKVADCILLMGYKKLEAFPVDTWVERTMKKVYGSDMQKTKSGNITMKEIRSFASAKWNGYAGYAQQYLYWYGREHVGRA